MPLRNTLVRLALSLAALILCPQPAGFVVLRAGRHRQASATLPGVRNAAA